MIAPLPHGGAVPPCAPASDISGSQSGASILSAAGVPAHVVSPPSPNGPTSAASAVTGAAGFSKLRVLVACEYSGRVRDAFIARGHDATSLDLLPTDALGPHVVADVVEYITSLPDMSLDLIIAHPPCTALTVAGNSTYGKGKPRHGERIAQAEWTENLWNLCKRKASKVAFENPVGVLSSMTRLPKPCFVHPWEHGHLEMKKTGLHLHNLDPIRPTHNVYDEMMKLPRNVRERLHYLPPSPDRWKIRSTTFQGIADAMADQWGREFALVAA